MANPTLAGLLLLTLICTTNSARILGIYPLPGHSHYHLARALFRELAERGHDVTVINAFGEKDPPKIGKYRDILLPGLFDQEPKDPKREWNMFKREGLNPFVGAYVVATMATKFIGHILNHTNVQNLLHSDEKFDVVIVDNFLSDPFKAFATHFDAPLIAVSPVWQNMWINALAGNPSPSSYVPNVLATYYHPMSFCDRLTNSLLDVFNYLLYYFYVFPQHNAFVKQYVPRGGDLNDILYNTSLFLINGHPSLNQPLPFVPNMIEVGGLHMKPPNKLPKDLQEFFDDAKQGVVYFSMGSNLKGVQFPPEKRQEFIKAFSKLKQKVLWKWEGDELPDQPSNVKIIKWAPQSDIFAHPNLKLFITHGGFVSSIESAYHGVPLLTIPIYGDQMQNAHFSVKNGYGRFLTYGEISEENLLENINAILDNPKYKENAKRRSDLFHDRPVSPLDTAVYWVEYVIKHRGAPHLRVAGVDLPWYQYLLLDVIAAIITIASLGLVVTCFITKKICQKVCSKRNNKKKKTA
ncbi:hypothetical protein Zmor_025269 [Zophobas morio]|uniref:UDP-glucuronosyltransferase n=1 Tax=Zophobas morio TaxID=2755281 RepID=A0AA38HRB6_9CUCU|nr:hypothetical protein Zmor_025269 [Zophobas morio]